MTGLVGAIEAGGTKFVLALTTMEGSIVDRTQIETGRAGETLKAVADWFYSSQGRCGDIKAFGVASFGPIGIDARSGDYGTFLTDVKPGWKGVRFQDVLGSFGVPIAIDTDVNGAALGEAMSGAGRSKSVVAYTTVGTGIGSGVVKNGLPVSGLSHYEAGHLRVPHDNEIDPFEGVCAYHGDCCEGLASGPAIKARWGGDLSTLDDPDKTALVGEYLGNLAATLAAFHMPEILVFGGGVLKAPGLLDSIRHAMHRSLAGYLAYYDRDLSEIVVAPQLGDDAGITGAAALGRIVLEKQA